MAGKVVPLSVSATATFVSDGAGGTVARTRVAPTVYGTKWRIQRVVVSTTTATNASTFALYRNTEADAALIDFTNTGDNDISETDIVLDTLDTLICVWAGGDLGAQCTATFTGDYETGRYH